MKRCIICGNVGADDSTTCEVCGNPYLDVDEDGNVSAVEMDEDISDMDRAEQEENSPEEDLPGQNMGIFSGEEPEDEEAAAAEPEVVFEEEANEEMAEKGESPVADWDKEEVAERPSAPAAKSSAPARRMKSEPHIYGQQDLNGQNRNGSGGAGRSAYGQRSGGARQGRNQEVPARRAAESRKAPAVGQEKGADSPRERVSRQPVSQDPRQTAAPETARRPMREQGNFAEQGSRGAIYGRPGSSQEGMSGRLQQREPVRHPVNMARDGAGQPVNGQRVPAGQPGAAPGGRPMSQQGRTGTGPAAPRPMNSPGARPANMQGRPANMGGSYRSARMKETSRNMLKSPVFLLVALLNTIYLASSVGAIFLKELNFSQVIRLLSSVELPAQITGYMDNLIGLMAKLDTDAIAVNLVMQIPNLLLCVGFWMIFLAGKSKKEEIPGGGFLLTKVFLIIGLVKYSVIMLAGLVISVALVVSAWASGAGGMKAAAVITLILMVVITLMMVMYYFCYMGTLKTCRINAGSGESYGRASAYVAVAHIFFGLLAVINLLSGIVNGEISGIIGGVSKMGWMILFAVWIFMYRGNMSEVEE